MNVNIIREYASILGNYMKKFGLESVDIAYLIKSTKKNIDSLLEESGSVELETLELISQIFGLRYFQFGDPNFKMPSFNSLPEKTKARIVFRKKEGPHQEKTYDQPLLNEKITTILAKYNKGDEFLTQHIVNKLFEDFKEEVSTSEVGKRLVNSLNQYVLQTKKTQNKKGKRGRKPYYFRLIKKIPAQVLAEAKEKVGEVVKEEPVERTGKQ
ncbi:hypothetical protein [Sinomicrobium oceani]|uniref:hypothetical protein n=1 Tax=Sinomicrobium oceani TaxID=1150368 RepID=UPI00227A5EF2|nr:hypothetical protein [Sinomicrobium oceani]